jgi:hypothetical protein
LCNANLFSVLNQLKPIDQDVHLPKITALCLHLWWNLNWLIESSINRTCRCLIKMSIVVKTNIMYIFLYSNLLLAKETDKIKTPTLYKKAWSQSLTIGCGCDVVRIFVWVNWKGKFNMLLNTTSGANPTTLSYNDIVVVIYSAIIAWRVFVSKIFFTNVKTL